MWRRWLDLRMALNADVKAAVRSCGFTERGDAVIHKGTWVCPRPRTVITGGADVRRSDIGIP